ncbi:MAG: hypothetical protein Q9175_007998, partial [Cornicularia normoerica]
MVKETTDAFIKSEKLKPTINLRETKEKPADNRYPPIIPSSQPRSSAAVPEDPYDVDPNRLRNGHAFSDISYAINIGEDVSQKDSVLVKSLPTIRLYKDATHYLESMNIEVKPQKWSSGDKTYAVRYLTLTAMTMLHEYLKLCYMSSNYDDKIIPSPKALSIHLIATIGHTASHYIHKIRIKRRGPLKYESHFAADFNLKEAGDRNQFRDRLNKIHVLYVTVFKEAIRETLKNVLVLRDSLGEREIYRRLEQRTHK